MSELAVQELRVAMTALAENPHVSEADFAAVCDAHLAVSQALFARVDALEQALSEIAAPVPDTQWSNRQIQYQNIARRALAASPSPEQEQASE